MNAVWTYWSRPAESGRSIPWRSRLQHFLAWGLSLHAARKHYPETLLVTDRNGKRLLIEKLGLPFTHVSTELDRLRDVDPGWWALGKLVSYSMQLQPFIHIDTDAFLWKRLPPEVEAAPVFAQCPEIHSNKHDCYQGEIERAFNEHHAKLPVEWEWERSLESPHFREENCGIVGGQNVAFLRYFAETALEMVLSPANAFAWQSLSVKLGYNMVIEQYLLSALIGFHRYHPESPYKGIKAKYLFASWEEGLDQNRTARLGFTHLMGGAKSHPAVARRLEERLRRDDPGYFRLCDRLARATA
jgi:Family of unknown function (DUF6734)